jgi:hypothetical protein
MISVWNLVWWNKNEQSTFQEELFRKVGCSFHLQTWSGKLILTLMITERNKQKGRAIAGPAL